MGTKKVKVTLDIDICDVCGEEKPDDEYKKGWSVFTYITSYGWQKRTLAKADKRYLAHNECIVGLIEKHLEINLK